MQNKLYLLLILILAMSTVGCNQKSVSEKVSEKIVVNEISNVKDIPQEITDDNEEISNRTDLTYYIDGEKQINIAKRINGEIYVPLIDTMNKFEFTVNLREDSKGEYYIFERTDGITQEIRVYINGLYFSLGDGSNPETFYDLNEGSLLKVNEEYYIKLSVLTSENEDNLLLKLYEFQGKSEYLDFSIDSNELTVVSSSNVNERYSEIIAKRKVMGNQIRLEIRELLENNKMSFSEIIRTYGNSSDVQLEITKFSETYDYDKDGLLDYCELFRNFTDPENPDTDEDGNLDGDWEERKEYTYTITAQLRIMQPYDIEYMQNHLYQDVKITEMTDEYLDCEIIVYPFNKFGEMFIENYNWKEDNKSIMEEVIIGNFNDWDETFQSDLIALLVNNGINPDELSDVELVRQVVDFISNDYIEYYINEYSNSAHMQDWFIEYSNEKPKFLDSSMSEVIEAYNDFNNNTDKDFSFEDYTKVSSSATDMFYYKTHGSCSSTSVFYANIFQALGIPTKVAPIATLYDTGKIDDESGGQHYSLYQDRMNIGNKFENEMIKEYWLEGLQKFATTHVTNLIYLGNKWVPMDVAGGQRINFNTLDEGGQKAILFFKVADYDFSKFNIIEVNRWGKDFNYYNISNSFTDSPSNKVNNHFDNVGWKLYGVTDEYGVHISMSTKEYIDNYELSYESITNR